MERKFLAKSIGDITIQKHSDDLLRNKKILNTIYPHVLSNWNDDLLLEKACIFHDIGKINDEFQRIMNGGHLIQKLNHGIYSLCFLNADDLCDALEGKYEDLGENDADEKAEADIRLLANAIARHHDRLIPDDWQEIIKDNLEKLKETYSHFKYDKIKDKSVELIPKDYFSAHNRINSNVEPKLFKRFILLKGILNRLDYAASGGIDVEKKNDFLLDKMNGMMKNWQKSNPKSDWNELQKYMIKNRDNNVIAIAQTGMGKTEAGLLWIGDNKGFFILPLKTAINAIYDRVRNGIIKENTEERIGILHSDAKEIYLNELKDISFDEQYEITKQLSLPLTICTLDQIFDFVFRYRGFEHKLATLSYSKIVLDEIQMYSPDLLAYVIKGLQYITEMGGKFCILTATFPEIIGDLLNDNGIKFEKSPNYTKLELPLRHNVKVLEKLIDTDDIIDKYDNNKILVICNTVREAQRVYDELSDKIDDKSKLNMFHSKFTKADRRKKENQILITGNKKSKETGIWVATQVVEASLDIDFDLLFTELSDINGLFQRMGRCYRNRPLNTEEINCYVYIGTDKKKNAGVGGFIDEKIYYLSRQIAKNKINGKLDEQKKMNLVSELYTTENMKEIDCYDAVKEKLRYLNLLDEYSKTKTEVKKEFRNIISYTVIPKSLYEANKDLINEKMIIINEPYSNNYKSREQQKIEKLKAKLVIKDFTVNIQKYDLKKTKLEELQKIELSKYDEIYIMDCDYNFETGFKNSVDNK